MRNTACTSARKAEAVQQLYNFSSFSYADLCNVQISVSSLLMAFWILDGIVLIPYNHSAICRAFGIEGIVCAAMCKSLTQVRTPFVLHACPLFSCWQ